MARLVTKVLNPALIHLVSREGTPSFLPSGSRSRSIFSWSCAIRKACSKLVPLSLFSRSSYTNSWGLQYWKKKKNHFEIIFKNWIIPITLKWCDVIKLEWIFYIHFDEYAWGSLSWLEFLKYNFDFIKVLYFQWINIHVYASLQPGVS